MTPLTAQTQRELPPRDPGQRRGEGLQAEVANQQDEGQEAAGEGQHLQDAHVMSARARSVPRPARSPFAPRPGHASLGGSLPCHRGRPARIRVERCSRPDSSAFWASCPDPHRHAAASATGRIAPRAAFVHQTRHPGIAGLHGERLLPRRAARSGRGPDRGSRRALVPAAPLGARAAPRDGGRRNRSVPGEVGRRSAPAQPGAVGIPERARPEPRRALRVPRLRREHRPRPASLAPRGVRHVRRHRGYRGLQPDVPRGPLPLGHPGRIHRRARLSLCRDLGDQLRAAASSRS